VKEVLGAIWEGLKTVARVWGRVVNTVLLSIVYFTFFGITALVSMVAGHDLLDTRPRPTAPSVWHQWERTEADLEDCLRQS